MSVEDLGAEARQYRGNGATAPSQGQEPPWPEPLAEAAYYGLAGAIVRAIEPQSEADPVALLLQLLAAFGNACGRSHYILVEADRHPPQIWPLLVGETGRGRKGTSWGRVLHLFEQADPEWYSERQGEGGLSSGEGLIWQVRDSKGEDEEETDDTDDAQDKRLFVVETEFASVLRQFERAGNNLSATLRNFWDRGNVRSLTKNSPAKTTGATLGVVGHITVEELRRYLTRTEAANGLANRFVFACVRRSKLLPFGGKSIDFAPLAEQLAQRLELVRSRGETRVEWSGRAITTWASVYSELSEGKPGLFGAATSRAEAQVLRLAVIHALLEGHVQLHRAHLQAALAVWRYCEQSAMHLFGTTLGDPVADEILAALKANPGGLTRNDLRNLFSRHQSSGAILTALNALMARGLARCERTPTAGRPEERWWAV